MVRVHRQFQKKSGEPTEEEKKTIKEWQRDDNKVCSWLIANMKPNISVVMSYKNSPQSNVGEDRESLQQEEKLYTHLSVTVRDSTCQTI
jgi:hypothetical protein